MTQYIQAGLFVLLAISAFAKWLQVRERPHAHLAFATMFFGLSQLSSAVTQTIYTSHGELIPRPISIMTGLLLYLYVSGFMLFLNDFIPFPRWSKVLFVTATVLGMVVSLVVRPEIALIDDKLVHLESVDNFIPYSAYITFALAYILLAFGVLFVSFTRYGLRVDGLARFRMLSIGGGFFLLFAAIALLPFILIGDPDRAFVHQVIGAVRLLALLCAPLLYLGFTPPSWVRRRVERPDRTVAA